MQAALLESQFQLSAAELKSRLSVLCLLSVGE